MAKKLSVDLELNAQGYTQGINEAKGATAQYTNATRDLKKETEEYLEQFGNLRKQFSTAKKEAQNLASAFSQLSKTEKEGELGKYMQEQLDLAIQKAAEFQDVMSDTGEAIKRTASDTQSWDALKDGLEIGKDLATAYAGAVAKLTGNEKALKDIVATVAMVQGAANAAIKIGNALQKQSNIMIALGNVQLKAKAAAESLATKQTIAATAAQRVFNAVAKANPYVLLATVAVAAATAIGGYMLATKKAGNETKLMAAKMESAKNVAKAFSDTLSSKTTELITKFTLLQSEYRNLSTNAEKVEWIKENSSAFNELGISIKTVNDADKVLIEQSADVIKALQLKAEAAALYAQYQKAMEEATQVSIDPVGQENEGDYAIAPIDPTIYTGAMVKQVNQAYAPVLDRVNDLNQQVADLLGKFKAKGKGSGNDKQLTELQKLEAEVTKYKNALENIDIKAPNSKELIQEVHNRLNKAQQAVKDYKLAVGIDIEKPKTRLDELKDELSKAKAELPFAITDEDVQKAWDKIHDLENKIENEEVRLKIKVEPAQSTKDVEKVNEILSRQLVVKPKFDFSGLKEDSKLGKEAEEALNIYDALLAKKKDLTDIMQNSTSDQAIHDAQKGLEEIEKDITNVTSKLEDMQKRADKINFKNDLGKNVKKGLSSLSDLNSSLSSIGNTWKSLDENWDDMSSFEKVTASFDAVVSSITQVIQAFEAITTVIQVFGAISSALSAKKTAENETEKQSEIGKLGAKQASSMANVTESGSKMPFPMNLVAIALGIAAVVAAFASIMGAFAEGGVVPGNSFTGDKLLARVNSGERILTAEQNKNVEKIANSVSGAGLNSGRVYVSGVIRGKDLLLVQKNYNTIGAKSGQSIKIG